ncbi:hypothetical protein DH2020_037251 [Rehmannia glutinosa]|uniref:Glutathione S-transferase n=1 Tax=Rehmannia glutinosa TaxID=99300 RepID=A0ABR0V4H2_REHGL
MEKSQVRLHGFWASAFVYRVIWALKLKGIEYEYIEEDLSNKSPSLLEYNPVYENADPHSRRKRRGRVRQDKEETAKQLLETLKIIQDQALGDNKFFGGNKIGLVDLSFGWLAHWLESIQELVGIHILTPNNLPRLHQWTLDFKQEPVIKENHPDSNSARHCWHN